MIRFVREAYSEGLEEILGLLVNLKLSVLGLGEVESGDLWNVLILALTLLLLKLEGDTADWATLNALHQVGGVTSDLGVELVTGRKSTFSIVTNLVAKTLGSNDGDLITDSLVGLEVEGQLWVVTLNDDLGGLLDSLSANATHFCGICRFGLSRNWLGMR